MSRVPVKPLILIVVIAVLPYLNTFKNDFVGYDDQNLIQRNDAIRSLSLDNIGHMFVPGLRGNYQPIRTLSYAVDYALYGPRAFGFHLTNIALNAAAVVCVWLMLRRLVNANVALLAAVVFAVLPIHAESVTWMSSRKDVLSLFFFLLAILWHESSESNDKPLLYAASIFATALALLSKLTAVTIPLCILLLEICRDGWPDRALWRRRLARLMPHVILVCLVVGLNFVQFGEVPAHGDSLAGLETTGGPVLRDLWLSMPMVVVRYLRLLVVPYYLSTHYQVDRISDVADARFLIPFLFLAAAAIAGVICFLRGRRAVAFCIGWFAITFLPTSNIVPAAALMVDRYMYVPSVGVAALLAMALLYPLDTMQASNNQPARRAALIPAVMVILLFSVLTIRRNTDWRDTSTLFGRTLLVNPLSVDAHLAIGAMREAGGDYNGAVEIYRQALEIAPGNYRVLYNLGVAYMKKGWLHQATRTLEDARAANPEFLVTHFNLALAYHQQGRREEAIAEHKEVLRLRPDYAPSHGDLGRLYLETGRTDLAMKELNLALQIQPDLTPALFDRAELLIMQGQYDRARDDLQRLASLGADTRDLQAKLREAM